MANHLKLNSNGVIEYAGANNANWMSNLGLKRQAANTIRITGWDGTALSATNPGWITLPSTVAAGALAKFEITADVDLVIDGMTPSIDTTGNVTGMLLRVLAINDNATLRWGVAYLGGRHTLLTTDTTATAASVNLPEHVFCTAAVASATNTCKEIGFFRADFNDTGNTYTIQTGIGDIVTGQTADGLWQPWNTTFTAGDWNGAVPTVDEAVFSQSGRTITLLFSAASATSNSSTYNMKFPTKIRNVYLYMRGGFVINAGIEEGGGVISPSAVDVNTVQVYREGSAGFTGAGAKRAAFTGAYQVGPAASFID